MAASGPPPDDTETKKARIERINELSQLARTAWFTLMGYLVFVGITLLGVRDADFFVPSRQTDLPLVNVAIPTASFFWTAPVLGAALYIYLHLFLIKLWDAHGEARTADADATHHWLVNDFALIRQGDEVARARPLWWLNDWVTRLLVWIAGPFVLAFAWWRSMPAHDEVMTLVIGACLWLSLVVGFTSWWRAESALGATSPHGWSRFLRGETAILVGAVLATVSWARTEERPFLARTDLADVALVPVPPDWRTPESARAAFRETWCKREGLSMEVCDQPVGADHETPRSVTADRATWCEEHGALAEAECTARFADLDRRFATAWEDERRVARDNLAALDLRGRDLRHALASGVSLIGADLRGARMEEADLSEARMEGANLRGARMEGANLRWARMEGANLSEARMEGADLIGARMEGADLIGARMEGADVRDARMEGAVLARARMEGAILRWARMEGADLSEARMEGANLSGARMEGANLRWARMEGADLSEARMEGADLSGGDFRESKWAGASNRASPAHFADLRGAQDLTQAQLEELIGNTGTLLPEGDAPDTQRPYYIRSCWEVPPPGFGRLHEKDGSTLSRLLLGGPPAYLCPPDGMAVKLYNGLALDAPYPDGHPLANREE